MRVLVGIPEGPTAKRRIRVDYRTGGSLVVRVDGTAVLDLELYDKVKPSECSWTLEGSALVVSMEKLTEKGWVDLTKPPPDVE